MRTVRLALFFVAACLLCTPALGLVIGDTCAPPADAPWPPAFSVANGALFDDGTEGVWPFDDGREHERGGKRTASSHRDGKGKEGPGLPPELMTFANAGPIGPGQVGTEDDLLSNGALRDIGITFAPPVPEPGWLFAVGMLALVRHRRR